jgi:hypothetical protein
MKSALREKRPNVRKFLGSKEPLRENMPKASIMEGLPFGNLGDFAIVCKGRMEGREGPVALKIARGYGAVIKKAWEEELEKSIKLSMLLPNVASYYSMVEVQGYPLASAFAMEIVSGYPVLDRNMDCLDAGRLKSLLSKGSIDQLRDSLEIASSSGWGTNDMQYFILLGDQTLNGKEHKKGDLILFDFWHWHQAAGKPRFCFDPYIESLSKILAG